MAKKTPEERAADSRKKQRDKAEKNVEQAAEAVGRAKTALEASEKRHAEDITLAASFKAKVKDGKTKIRQAKAELKRAEGAEKRKRKSLANVLAKHSSKIRRG